MFLVLLIKETLNIRQPDATINDGGTWLIPGSVIFFSSFSILLS